MGRATQRVRARVLTLSRSARQAIHARAVCSGLAAGLVCLALGGGSQRSPFEFELVALAVVTGLMTFVTWSGSSRVEPRAIAIELDDTLSFGGGLVAAFENGARPERTMAELGAETILERGAWRSAREVAVPHSVGFLVMPLIAAALLLQVASQRGDGTSQRELDAAAIAELAGGIELARARHGEALGEEQNSALGQAAASAREAASGAEAGAQDMGALAEQLEELASELPAGSDAAEDLWELAEDAGRLAPEARPAEEEPAGLAALDPNVSDPALPEAPRTSAPNDATGAGAGGPSGEPQGNPQAGERLDAAPGDPGESGGSAAGSAGSGLAVGPDPGTGGAPTGALGPAARDASGSGRGTRSGDVPPRTGPVSRWWGDRDDALVRRWMARSTGNRR